MTSSSPDRTQEIELLKAAYAALNRNDIEGFIAHFDPNVERVEFAETPQGSAFHDLEAMKEHVIKGRGGWAEGACEPQRFTVVGDHIIILIHVRVRLKTETQWREGEVGDLFTFRNGKVTLFRSFSSEAQALEWADTHAST